MLVFRSEVADSRDCMLCAMRVWLDLVCKAAYTDADIAAVSVQFKSRPRKPSPLFLGLCLAAAGKLSGHSFSPMKAGLARRSVEPGNNGGDVSRVIRSLNSASFSSAGSFDRVPSGLSSAVQLPPADAACPE